MKSKVIGKIISLSGDQTAKVEINLWKTAPIIKKNYRVNKKILVHNPQNKFTVGDRVVVSVCRPISKRKFFIIKEKVKDDTVA